MITFYVNLLSSQSAQYFAKTYMDEKLIGGTYKKSRYVEYDNPDFSVKRNRSAAEEHMGLLGPAIRAEVGDVIRIVLNNKTPYPVSIFPHGVSLDSSQNGMRIKSDGRTSLFLSQYVCFHICLVQNINFARQAWFVCRKVSIKSRVLVFFVAMEI